ncbi:hypothetical protein LTR85_002118 [Meristemomyces frigidus]|nr:hypothetical protein LTR85_002118 [Meristemomyces frigidus]
MPPVMEPYHYQKLDESARDIRIVVLPPGSLDDELQISLHTISLPDTDGADDPVPDFEALSYTWGSLTDPVSLRVSDEAGPVGTIAIMKNLATALPYLRATDQERCVWIDAISINQQDLAERNSQVKLMSAIYKQARRVTLWLGLEDAYTEKAYRLLTSLGTSIEVDWPTKTMCPVSAEHAALVDKSEPLSLSSKDYQALHSIFVRPWFDRLWIRQEVQLAQEAVLTCGHLTMDWTAFRNAVYCFSSKPSPGGELVSLIEGLGQSYTIPFSDKRLSLIVDLIEYGGAYEDLGHRIYRAGDSQCHDPRDRIYAVTSLLYEDEQWDLSPTIHCLRRGQGGSVLHVKGIRVGSVLEVTQYLPDGPTLLEDIKELRRLLRRGLEWLTADTDATRIALNRTFSGRNHRDMWDPANFNRLTALEERSAIDVLLDVASSEALCEEDSHVRRYVRAAVAGCRHRTLFATDTECVGLGPRGLRAGDRVTVLFGARKPMALRLVGGDDSDTFQVVGECYIDPLMSGDTFLGPLPEHWEWINKKAYEGYYRDMYRDAYRDNRTSTIKWDDPGWVWLLGEDYPDQGCLETAEEKEQNQMRIDEVVKLRQLECVWFGLV